MLLTVVIPVKNGASTLSRCLDSIKQQTIAADIEIVVLLSTSTDDSRFISEQYNATIIDVPDGSFNHGLTRNLGVEHANGSLLFYTVQDAWIEDELMLEKMSAHFNNLEVMGVVGHQAVPHEADKNPAVWFKRYTEPTIETRSFPNGSFEKLSSKQQFELSNWDDVCAMYRKEALLKIPFKETSFSEDWLWANESLQSGFTLLRDPSLVVYHYHHLTFGYVFKTAFTVNYYFFLYFNQLPTLSFSPIRFIKKSYSIFKNREVAIFKKPYWIMYNLLADIGAFLSVLLFRLLCVFGEKVLLTKAFNIVCNQVPQGALKK